MLSSQLSLKSNLLLPLFKKSNLNLTELEEEVLVDLPRNVLLIQQQQQQQLPSLRLLLSNQVQFLPTRPLKLPL